MAKQFFLTSILLLHLLINVRAAQAPYRKLSVVSLPKYSLDIRIIPDAQRLDVTGTMQLPPVNTLRTEVQLSLSKLMRDFSVEVLEPAASAGVARVERGGASSKNIQWIARPRRPIAANQAVRLRFSYSGGEQIANQFYIGSEVSFASAWGTDWYPLVVGENDKGVGTLRFSVPAGQTVYATGNRHSSPQEEEKGVFRFETIHPTYFSFAAGNYTVIRRKASVPIAVYLLRPRQNMEQYLDGVSSILNILTQEFGRYPFDEFALVEIPRNLTEKASFIAAAAQGFILINSRAFDVSDVKYILNLYGHEFSHQWFPHAIALKTPPGLYMEEALAEYGGLRVVETLAGAEAAERYRRRGFEYDPYFSAVEYFKLVGAGLDHPLSGLQPKLEHRNLAYNKGFLVFYMLAREVGIESFRRILHGITRRHAFREITWNEFLRTIEVGTGRNLRWFYEQWFGRTGAPDWQLMWKQEGKMLRGSITQPVPYYRGDIEVQADGNNSQRIVRTLKVRGPRTEFAWPVKFRVQTVVLDPRYLVLHWTPEYHAVADAAHVPK